jgi:predicted membrane channel-forming protein YqfA (hemolysin III family)
VVLAVVLGSAADVATAAIWHGFVLTAAGVHNAAVLTTLVGQ